MIEGLIALPPDPEHLTVDHARLVFGDANAAASIIAGAVRELLKEEIPHVRKVEAA